MSNVKFISLLFLGVAFLGCTDIPDELRDGYPPPPVVGGGSSSSVASSSNSVGDSWSSSVPSSSSSLVPSSSSVLIQTGVIYGTPVYYEGDTYETVVIGTQTWMAKNLNYDFPDNDTDVCYDNDPANCAIYGRLYNWTTVMNIDYGYSYDSWGGSDVKHQGICPSGWHIPSDTEWTTLIDFVGGSSTAGGKLRAINGWNGNSTDEFGFSALPGGAGYFNGSFYNVGSSGYWWSSSEDAADTAYRWSMSYRNEHSSSYFSLDKSSLQSVRCVQD